MAQSPCFTPLANSLLLPFHSLLLTWKPSFGVMRSCPPWPQVTRTLTFPFPSPPHSKFPTPRVFHELIVRLTKTTSRTRPPRSGTLIATSYWPPPPSPNPSHFQPHMPTRATQFPLWKMTLAPQKISLSGTSTVLFVPWIEFESMVCSFLSPLT